MSQEERAGHTSYGQWNWNVDIPLWGLYCSVMDWYLYEEDRLIPRTGSSNNCFIKNHLTFRPIYLAYWYVLMEE